MIRRLLRHRIDESSNAIMLDQSLCRRDDDGNFDPPANRKFGRSTFTRLGEGAEFGGIRVWVEKVRCGTPNSEIHQPDFPGRFN